MRQVMRLRLRVGQQIKIMTIEQKSEENEFLSLTTEQNKLVSLAQEFFKAKLTDEMSKEEFDREMNEYNKRIQQLMMFREESLKEGWEPKEYVLWHKAFGSSAKYIYKFDTPDDKIKKFIESLINSENKENNIPFENYSDEN